MCAEVPHLVAPETLLRLPGPHSSVKLTFNSCTPQCPALTVLKKLHWASLEVNQLDY